MRAPPAGGECLRRLTAATVTVLALAPAAGALAPQAQAKGPGSLDRSFSDDGRRLTDFFGRNDRAAAVAVQEGRIVVAGRAGRFPDIPSGVVARHRRDGRLDRGFGHGGKAILRRSSETGALAIQPNGKILAAGDRSFDLAVTRLRRDGPVDRSFGKKGTVRIDFPGLNQAADIALQPDGKIVVVGSTRAAGGGDHYLIMARYLRDGSLDPSFADEGTLQTRFGHPADTLGSGLAIQGDGKIVLSGEIGNNWIVARLLEDGSLDPSFDEDGINFGAPKLVGRARDVEIQPDGRIVATGSHLGDDVSRFDLARYLPDGSFDESFGEDGAVHTGFGARRRGFAYSLALQADGRIVVAGSALDRHDDSRFALARYRPNGELDRRFGNRGKATMGFPDPLGRRHDDHGRAVAIQADGAIVVAGGSDPYRGNEDFALARFLG